MIKIYQRKLVHILKNIKNIQSILFLCPVLFICCGYIDPADLIFKNINLLPDPIDHTNRYPNLTKDMYGKKSETIIKTKKIPTINADPVGIKVSIKKPAKDVFNLYNDLFSVDNVNVIKAENIKKMFNVDKIDPNGKIFQSGVDIPLTEDLNLPSMTKKIPVINDLPAFPLYNGKTWIVKSINDVKVNDMDKVLPTSVADPQKSSDYNIDPVLDIFPESIAPDNALNTKILDILP